MMGVIAIIGATATIAAGVLITTSVATNRAVDSSRTLRRSVDLGRVLRHDARRAESAVVEDRRLTFQTSDGPVTYASVDRGLRRTAGDRPGDDFPLVGEISVTTMDRLVTVRCEPAEDDDASSPRPFVPWRFVARLKAAPPSPEVAGEGSFGVPPDGDPRDDDPPTGEAPDETE